MRTLFFAARMLCAAFALAAAAVHGQPSFPSKPVRFVVPFPPGGQSDTVARMVAEKLAARWGQPVVVENRPGAAATIGADLVAKAPADGHTMLFVTAPFVITQYAYPRLPYDSRRDFTPVSLLVTNPMVLVTNPSKVPGKTLTEFVDFAKKNPGSLAYGTPGNGSLPHLGVELLQLQAGVQLLHVPYKGAAAAVTDLIAGRLSFVLLSPLGGDATRHFGKIAGVGDDLRPSGHNLAAGAHSEGVRFPRFCDLCMVRSRGRCWYGQGDRGQDEC